MSTKIFVGNLPFSVTDASLRSNFGEFGTVSSAKVMMDRDTQKSKGFGFVEMASAEHAQAAINGLNGMSVDGRTISVSLARPREDRTTPGGHSAQGYRASHRSNVGYGTDGFGGRG
jgi:RNA recognition motif-containing protein